MGDDVEIEKEVKSFNFRHLCKLKIGGAVSNPNDCYNHLAVLNKYGILLVVSSTNLKVISITTLEKISLTTVDVNNAVAEYASDTIPVGLAIERVSVTCDEANIVITYKDAKGVHIGAISTSILASQDKSNAVYSTTTLHNSSDVFVKDVRCHPDIQTSSIMAVLLSNGHVFMVDLNPNDGFKVFASLTQGSPVCSLCWSPKGKQIVLGFADGKLIQYDKLLKSQKKVTNAPFTDSQKQVSGLFWISSYLFMAVYNSADRNEGPIFVMVGTQKEGPPSYSIMDDIYFGFNEDRVLCYYFSYIPAW
jgi:nuclear pore complex protein Nup214